MNIQIQGTPTYRDFLESFNLQLSRKNQFGLPVRIFGYLFAFIMLSYGFSDSADLVGRIIAWVIVIFISAKPIYRFVIIPLLVWRVMLKIRSSCTKLNAKITDEGIMFLMEESSVTHKWTEFDETKEGRRVIVLRLINGPYYFFPKRFIGSNENLVQFRTYIAERLEKKPTSS